MCKRIYKEQTSNYGDVPFFKIGTFGSEPDAFITDELYEQYRSLYPYPKPGTLLISAAGSIGRIVEYKGERAYYQDSNIVWLEHNDELDDSCLKQSLTNVTWTLEGSTIKRLYNKDIMGKQIAVPSVPEQRAIGALFSRLDDLIALHQRKLSVNCGVSPSVERRKRMAAQMLSTDLFCDYYRNWITTYKEGAIRKVTMEKYLLTASWLEKLAQDLPMRGLNRNAYQQLLNRYAESHERQTTMDFHHHLKCAILDAVDEGLIERDPTRKAVIKGRPPRSKKPKYLNQFELHKLLDTLRLEHRVNWDWLILLIAKTGLRFSEALAVTPSDFNFARQILSIDKTWNYKDGGGFLPTKNHSSVRKVQLDWQLIIQFAELIREMPPDQPIFVKGKVYNSTVNAVLSKRCVEAGVPGITIHGLRHTHASLLLFAGVSIASVAKRLGHSSTTTTQKVYLHVIQELENRDVDLVMRSLSGLS